MPHLFLDTERMANLTSGMGQVCLNLGRELVRQKPADWDITFLVAPNQVGIFGDTVRYRVATRWNRLIQFWKYDVWHCLHQDTHYYPALPTQFVYTVLDLNYLALPYYTVFKKERRRKRYQARINQASVVTTISKYVAQDVCQQLSVPAQKPVEVIYCGVALPKNAPKTPPAVMPGGPFLFFIGLLQAYKNVHTLLPLLVANPALWLVLAGPAKTEYSQQLWEQANQLGVADRLLLPGPVDEATKWWFYANCEAFMFPSLLEGFGIPVVEAMSFGKPVFSSPLTSLPEVGGDVAFYFPSFDAETVVETYRKGMKIYQTDPDMPEQLRHQSQKFSWEIAAAQYWQLYQRIH